MSSTHLSGWIVPPVIVPAFLGLLILAAMVLRG